MPSFDVEIEFEVYCATCGAGLCGQSDGSHGSRGPRVDVEVCETCVNNARDEGYQEGYDEAEKDYESA